MLGLIILTLPFSWVSCLGLMFALAFIGATYDIFADGIYLHNLNTREQSTYIGIRTLSYQLARISIQGGIITLAGYFIHHFSLDHAWQLTFFIVFVATGLILIYQSWTLPQTLPPGQKTQASPKVLASIKQFFKLRHIGLFFCFTFLFNFPEAQLQRVIPLFLLDPHGLNLSVSSVGIIYGFLGSSALLIGTTLTGLLAAKYGVKRFILLFLGLATLSNLTYVGLAYIHTAHTFSFCTISLIVAQFAFGCSNTIYMLALMNKIKNEPHKMSYYAFLTAIMAISFVIFGAISGTLQHWLGYKLFFLWIVAGGFIAMGVTYKVVKHDRTL